MGAASPFSVAMFRTSLTVCERVAPSVVLSESVVDDSFPDDDRLRRFDARVRFVSSMQSFVIGRYFAPSVDRR